MATRRFEIKRYSRTCYDCKHDTFPVFIYETRWNVGYDWEDGDTLYFCPVCEAKNQLNILKYVLLGKYDAIKFGIEIFRIHFKHSKDLKKSIRVGIKSIKLDWKNGSRTL